MEHSLISTLNKPLGNHKSSIILAKTPTKKRIIEESNPYRQTMIKENKASFSDLCTSLIALTLVFLLSSSITFSMVSDRLITSPLTSNSRYAVTFPALDYIGDQDEDAVIAIGSSIIQAAVDGVCITEQMNTPNTDVFNLGISGANPTPRFSKFHH